VYHVNIPSFNYKIK